MDAPPKPTGAGAGAGAGPTGYAAQTFVAEFTVWINNIDHEAAGPAVLAGLTAQVLTPLQLQTPGAPALLRHYAHAHGTAAETTLPDPLPRLVRVVNDWTGVRTLKGRTVGNMRLVLGFITAYKMTLHHAAWTRKVQEILGESGHASSIPYCRVRITFTGRSRLDMLYRPYIAAAVAETQRAGAPERPPLGAPRPE